MKIIFLILFFLTTCCFASERPNVIIVLTDDQGYGDISRHGNPHLSTPHLDRLYDDGVRLTDFHVDPTCSPTRAALLTGRYSSRTGVWLTYSSRHHLRRNEVTMADVFKENGYKTAMFGKWHLGECYPYRPMDRGFSETLYHGGGMVSAVTDYWDNNYYDDVYFRNGTPEKVSGYCTDVWFEESIRFIEKNRNAPFFIYLATNAVHSPLHVPEKYTIPFVEKGLGKLSRYYGTIVNIDENVGKLRRCLSEMDLERDTILIFLNDNGTGGGVTLTADENGGTRNGWEVEGYNAGMRGKKASRYEGAHRAACFIHWPQGGLKGGRDFDELTAHIDLMPTLMEMCNLETDHQIAFDGASLVPVFNGEDTALSERSIMVHDQGRFGDPIGQGLLIKDKDLTVMRGKWRLVDDELYDMRTDPRQKSDVAQQNPELVQQLRQDYESWWASISERSEEYCPIVVNPSIQKVATITTQDLLGGLVAYSQRHVRAAMPIEGWAVIDVEVPGSYEISVRRWPAELNAPIRSADIPEYPMDPSTHAVKKVSTVALNITSARLKVGDFDQSVVVGETDKAVVFEVNLPRGEHKIQSWFAQENGKTLAPYYTYIEAK